MRRDRLYSQQMGLCYWCKTTMQLHGSAGGYTPPDYATFEHLKPFAEGGRWVGENIVLACYRCNSGRAARLNGQYGMGAEETK